MNLLSNLKTSQASLFRPKDPSLTALRNAVHRLILDDKAAQNEFFLRGTTSSLEMKKTHFDAMVQYIDSLMRIKHSGERHATAREYFLSRIDLVSSIKIALIGDKPLTRYKISGFSAHIEQLAPLAFPAFYYDEEPMSEIIDSLNNTMRYCEFDAFVMGRAIDEMTQRENRLIAQDDLLISAFCFYQKHYAKLLNLPVPESVDKAGDSYRKKQILFLDSRNNLTSRKQDK